MVTAHDCKCSSGIPITLSVCIHKDQVHTTHVHNTARSMMGTDIREEIVSMSVYNLILATEYVMWVHLLHCTTCMQVSFIVPEGIK